MKERLVELIRKAERNFLTNGTNIPQMAEVIVDHLLANNVMVLPYKPFPVVLSEDENNSDVFCPFCDTNLSGHYYGGDYEPPKIVTCFGCGTWLNGTKAITKEEATKLKEGGKE